MSRLNLKDVSQSKRRLIYKIFSIYKECGFLEIYKMIGPLESILKFNEYCLAFHLENLEQGKPDWIFSFKGGQDYVPNNKPKPEKPKIVRQMPLWGEENESEENLLPN